MKLRLVVVLAALIGLACGATSALAASGAPAASGALAETQLQANQAIARRDARALLEQLQLPSGVTSSATEPMGVGTDLLKPPRVWEKNTIGVSRWMISPESPAALLAYVGAHPPRERGFRQQITEGSTVIFTWIIDGQHLLSQDLQITVAPLADGHTGLMAEAQSVWMVPRPASERVGPGIDAVDLTLRIGSGPAGVTREHVHRYVFTRPTQVTNIVQEFNRLPISQPGLLYSCPAMLPRMPLLTLRFMGANGSTLARAAVTVHSRKNGYAGWNSCDPIDFWIGARQLTPLTSHTFVVSIGKLIGTSIS